MAAIIVSADYFGKALGRIRHSDNISTNQLTHLLGCDAHQLHHYIHGKNLIPQDVLRRIFKYAVMMDAMLSKD